MGDVILTTIKKLLGLSVEDDSFDTDVIIGINSAITNLNTLGVGPSKGFIITNTTVWSEFIGMDNENLESVKTYIYLSLRLSFDPPQNSFLVSSIEKQLAQYGWNLGIQAEGVVL